MFSTSYFPFHDFHFQTLISFFSSSFSRIRNRRSQTQDPVIQSFEIAATTPAFSCLDAKWRIKFFVLEQKWYTGQCH
ncbi:hypothetical protein P8452_04298 [Trifolium repens]|nr:hypothetical protein P8452_04298 [Trifolium repens]